MQESNHGGSYGMHQGMTSLNQSRQYFSSLNFPVKDASEVWKEKVIKQLASKLEGGNYILKIYKYRNHSIAWVLESIAGYLE